MCELLDVGLLMVEKWDEEEMRLGEGLRQDQAKLRTG